MLKIKSVVIAAAVMAAAATLSAQITLDGLASPVSFTSVSTNDLFGTDVDDYLDVNYWNGVQPKKVFGYFGYNIDTNTNLNFGIAKQFKKMYSGAFFNGQFDGFTTNATSDDASGADKSSSSLTSANNGAFTFATLFGFGNGVGTKFSIYYKPTSVINTDRKDTNDKKYSNYADKFVIYPEFQIGTTSKKKNYTLTPHATLGLDSKVDITTVNNDGTKTVTDNSIYVLTVNAGTGISYPEKDGIKKDASLDLNTAWSLYALDQQNNDGKKTKVFGHVDNDATLTGKYTIGFTPAGKLSVKVRGELPIAMNFHCDSDYTDVDGTKTYTAARNNWTKIGLAPAFKIALQYPVLKNKVFLNTGFKFNVPSCNWNINRLETRKASDGSVDSKKWTNDFTFVTADMSYALNFGFSGLLGKNVTFDANYNILQNIFGGTNTVNTNNLFASGTSIWNAPGKVFAAPFQFLLTIKL